MKVLVVTHVNDLSGANKSLLSIVEQLHDKVMFNVVVNKKNGELSEALEKKGIEVIYCKYNWWYAKIRVNFFKRVCRYIIDFFSYYFSCLFFDYNLNKLKKNNYDLIYTNTSTVSFGSVLAKKMDLPHVWHVREFGKEDFGFRRVCNIRFYKRCFRNADKIIAISNAVKKKYSLYVPNNKISVVYNGFNVSKLISNLGTIDKKKSFSILIVGQVCEAKCQDQAIQACKLLVERGLNIELHLAGAIDYSYLQKEIPNYKNYNWLFLEGQVKNIYNFRNKMDIELVCSRSEAFGRVTIEAMLHGLPVIASNRGGNTELIRNGKNGLLYYFGNIKDLSDKIKLLYIDKVLYRRIQENAQDFAKRFTIEDTSRNVFNVFKEVVHS